MTMITVRHPQDRIDSTKRSTLAQSLTDAVLKVECGQILPAARAGFQVCFQALPEDAMAIGGKLICDAPADVLFIDIAVMDGAWSTDDRRQVIQNVFAALCNGLDVPAPSPTWWINFRIIPEGSWGSRGGVLSILDLLSTGAFTDQKAAEIRVAIQHRVEGAGQN